MAWSVILLAGVAAAVLLIRPPSAERRLIRGAPTWIGIGISRGGIGTSREGSASPGPPRAAQAPPAPESVGWRQAASTVPPPESAIPAALVLDLVAALVDAGASPVTATRTTGAAMLAAGDARGRSLVTLADELLHPPPVDAAGGQPAQTPVVGGLDALAATLRLAARSGLPPAGLIRQAAAEERRRSAASHRRAMRRLEVLLVLPLGLCLLPAFVLLGVVPVVIDLLGG